MSERMAEAGELGEKIALLRAEMQRRRIAPSASDGGDDRLQALAEPETSPFGNLDELGLVARLDRLASARLHILRNFGEDSRTDIPDIPPRSPLGVEREVLLSRASAVLAMVDRDRLVRIGDLYRLAGRKYSDAHDLCPNVRFAEQTIGVTCTAFLISKRLVATAGHCVDSPGDVSASYFVRGYWTSGARPVDISPDEVFTGRRITSKVADPHEDWGLVELDAEVDVEPLVLNRGAPVSVSTSVHTLGFPLGLPMKFAHGALVTLSPDDAPWFRATVDTFEGNSGAPIINDRTGEVEGILVDVLGNHLTWPREEGGGCNKPASCVDGACIGEFGTKISRPISGIPRELAVALPARSRAGPVPPSPR